MQLRNGVDASPDVSGGKMGTYAKIKGIIYFITQT